MREWRTATRFIIRQIEITNPGGRTRWTLYASRTDAVRLVVFVHGFAGKTVKTWE